MTFLVRLFGFVLALILLIANVGYAANAVKGKYRILGFDGCGESICYSVRVVDTAYSLGGLKTEQRRWVVDSTSSPLSETALFAVKDLRFRVTKDQGAVESIAAAWSNSLYALDCSGADETGDWSHKCAKRSDRQGEHGLQSASTLNTRSQVACEGCLSDNLKCTLSKNGSPIATGTGQYLAGKYSSSISDISALPQCGSDIFPTIPVLPPAVR